ncbi:hypothetical protein HNQ02_003290 [Flavobacterium sp. 7E]|nr:hypothetical protein [Flavobacterium sp. 7E]
MKFYFFNGERYTLYNDDFYKMNYQKAVVPNNLFLLFSKNKKSTEAILNLMKMKYSNI